MSADLAVRNDRIMELTRGGGTESAIATRLGVSISIVRNVRRDARRAAATLAAAGAIATLRRSGPGLTAYEAAIAALAEAKAVDQVKDIADKAEAMRVYARQAKNRTLEIDAAEIRIRAERRLGAMIAAQKATEGLNRGRAGKGRPPLGGADGEPPKTPPPAPPHKGEGSEPPTLAEIGIDRKLSSRAQRLAAMPDGAFAEQLAAWRDKVDAEGERVSVMLTRGDLAQDKAERRERREAALAARITALPERRYGVILADPEWRFEPRSIATGMNRAPDNHYPTSTLEAICARPVADIAARDCVLFLWATVPMLAEAFCVLDAWGFAPFVRDDGTGFLRPEAGNARYVSSAAWIKYRPGAGVGLGYWFRIDHELLLVATRGAPVCPAPGVQSRSVIDEPASRVHSQKPELVHAMIERHWPNTPKVELNARARRPGWDAWGNEA